MTESKQVLRGQPNTASEAEARATALRPSVDIFEDKTGITVQADMPGVAG